MRVSLSPRRASAAKQVAFIQEVEEWLEDDLKTKLEEEYGRLPNSISAVISAGEEKLTAFIY
jgi:hypothetical protein